MSRIRERGLCNGEVQPCGLVGGDEAAKEKYPLRGSTVGTL